MDLDGILETAKSQWARDIPTIRKSPDRIAEDWAAAEVETARTAERRAEIRRDTGELFTVDAQGIEGGRPFASRTEWSRAGHC